MTFLHVFAARVCGDAGLWTKIANFALQNAILSIIAVDSIIIFLTFAYGKRGFAAGGENHLHGAFCD